MAPTNISVVINNYFTNNEQKIYSVIVAHEAEVHENYLFTDKGKAITKMKSIVENWKNGKKCDGFVIHKYSDGPHCPFTPQYETKMGYWYENGEWEYGYVELVECVLE